MGIKKKYIDESSKCKVTFTIPSEVAKKYKKANLVGDFNNWDVNAATMKKMKRDGSFSITVTLEKNHEYQFRYLLNGSYWTNEPEADKLVPTFFGDAQNSVIIL